MKNRKLLFVMFLFVMMMILPCLLLAQNPSKGSGLRTSSDSVILGTLQLSQLVVIPGTADAVVTLYDSATAAGDVVTTWTCSHLHVEPCIQDWPYPGRTIKNGIYVSISGTGSSYIVEWSSR